MIAPTAEIPSRDVSIGRVFERAIATIQHNPLTVLLLAFLFGALPNLAFLHVMDELERSTNTDSSVPGLLVYLATGIFLWSILASLVQAVLSQAVIAESEGKRTNLARSFAAAGRVAPAFVGLTLVTSLAMSLGLLVLIVPGLVLWVLWSVTIPVLIQERNGIAGALHRSSRLTKDVRWLVLALLLILLVAGLVESAGVELVSGEWQNSNGASELRNPTYVALLSAGDTMLSAFSATVIASLYVELRNSKEGPTSERLEQVFA